MQVAEMLSDLNTLYLADPKAALALVQTRPTSGSAAGAGAMTGHEDSDVNLKRAQDLLELHAEVKVAHQDGTDKELNEAREAVAKVLREA